MPLKKGSDRETISENIAELVRSGKTQEQAAAIAYKYAQDGIALDSAQETDVNGFITIEGNPLSKVGVFPYLGKNLPDAEPGKMYNVYRPANELSDPECLKSFQLLPLVDDHEMLGDEYTPPERKGIHGITGEGLYFKDNTVFGNLRLYSDKIKNLIKSGKKQLSMGYRCVFEKASGVFEGQTYDYIQREIRGNHVALVKNGRMGADVAVLDHFTVTLDEKDIPMEDKDKAKDEGLTLESLLAMIKALEAKIGAKAEGEDTKAPNATEGKASEGDESEEEKAKEGEEGKSESEDEEEKKDKAADKKAGMDAADEIKSLKKKLSALEASSSEKSVAERLNKRNQLASQVSRIIGVFDHSDMTFDEVAQYAADKLKLKCEKGQAHAVVQGYLAAKSAPAAARKSVATDGKENGMSIVRKHITGKKD